MWQLTEDLRNKKIKADLYVDDWPNFTTFVSKEFSPCLSKVSNHKNKYQQKSHNYVLLKL